MRSQLVDSLDIKGVADRFKHETNIAFASGSSGDT
jgi:hypothetical protein